MEIFEKALGWAAGFVAIGVGIYSFYSCGVWQFSLSCLGLSFIAIPFTWSWIEQFSGLRGFKAQCMLFIIGSMICFGTLIHNLPTS